MIFLFFFLIPVVYLLVKTLLFFITKMKGKFSFYGFSAAGFAYDKEKDIFYSTKNAWQKNFGYTRLYDVAAPILRMIVDTEIIKFKYDEKNWMIAFWKGQYGIVTGAEMGIYYTKEKKIDKNTLYFPVQGEEMLEMRFVLYKNDNIITEVDAKHWWLAAFKLGMFSRPKDLAMDLSITFPNEEMLNAFLESFKKLKHKKNEYSLDGNTFHYRYTKPKTRKVWTRSLITDAYVQHKNKKNVRLYDEFCSDALETETTIDPKIICEELIKIDDLVPEIFKEHLEEKEYNRIAEEIVSKKRKNVVWLNPSIGIVGNREKTK